MVLVSIFSLCGICYALFGLMMDTSPNMLRRLWTKDWPKIVITLGVSWAYAITAFTISPTTHHGIWLLSFRVFGPTFLYSFDAQAVYFHLRLHPKQFWRTFGTENEKGKKKNSTGMIFIAFWAFYLIVMDIARHYLVVQLSENVNLIALSITNPFNNKPITFDNIDLATALFWTATIFMSQSFWIVLTKNVLQVTVTDVTHYNIVLKTLGDRRRR